MFRFYYVFTEKLPETKTYANSGNITFFLVVFCLQPLKNINKKENFFNRKYYILFQNCQRNISHALGSSKLSNILAFLV